MENISWPENIRADRIKAIEKLILGRQFANQLRHMVRQPAGDNGSSSLSDVVSKILDTFTDSISLLTSPAPSDEVSQIPANTPVCSDGRKSEDSGDSTKTSFPAKDRRGCYKRRKTSQTWTRLAPTLMDDGHAWRKYGQKIILHAKHPRNYYRCTHKFDQGCEASKQVQRTEDNPPMYKITYNGHHTCKNLLKSTQFLLDPCYNHGEVNSSIFLSFGSSQLPNNPTFTPFSSLKEEQEEKPRLMMMSTHCNIPCSSFDYHLISPSDCNLDHALDSSGPPIKVMTPSRSDHGDVVSSGVYSSTDSTHNLDMDFMVGAANFDDDFLQYDFC